jgi:hypothetical protein
VTTHGAESFARTPAPPASPSPLSAGPVVDYWSPLQSVGLRRWRAGDRYFLLLCITLFGYALGGRGFAYWGVNPLFVGEIMLVVGSFVLLKSGMLTRVLGMQMFMPLLIFMGWGAVCTIPHLDTYGKDAIRDAVVWGYGTYAFIVAALLMADPTRVQKLVFYYRKFVVWFLILAPISWAAWNLYGEYLPVFPGGQVPIVQMKGGDMCVHLGGVFAYVVALGAGLNPWLPSLLIPFNLGLNLQGRAGMVAFMSTVFMAMILRPFHPRMMRILFVISLGLFFLWASNVRIERGAREISFDGLVTGLSSIFGDSGEEALGGTKEWRMNWWADIVKYTFGGKYFWMGKGFGINLATDDGYQHDEEESLRSPHNGHMTMLARAGVPGLTFWLILQATWAVTIVKSYFRARGNRHMNWSGVFMFIGSYWAAFMANTTFDVFIEGPMGGIWFWCIYGAGLGCAYLYKRYPTLLTPPPQPAPIYVPVSR